MKNKALATATDEKRGIVRTRPVVMFLATLLASAFTLDSNKDGMISFVEILNKLQVMTLSAFGTFSGFSRTEFLAEIKDLDATERAVLVEDFAQKFELQNEVAELLVEDWLRWLESGLTMVERTIRFTKAKELAQA